MPDIAQNRKARHEYEILDKFEAGIELKGTEVKAIRLGKINIRDAFIRVEGGQAFLYGCDIQPYECASHVNHEAKRTRRLLLNRREIDKLDIEQAQKGLALIATRVYWLGQRVKVEVAVGRGKSSVDKRHAKREAIEKREADRTAAAFNRRG